MGRTRSYRCSIRIVYSFNPRVAVSPCSWENYVLPSKSVKTRCTWWQRHPVALRLRTSLTWTCVATGSMLLLVGNSSRSVWQFEFYLGSDIFGGDINTMSVLTLKMLSIQMAYWHNKVGAQQDRRAAVRRLIFRIQLKSLSKTRSSIVTLVVLKLDLTYKRINKTPRNRSDIIHHQSRFWELQRITAEIWVVYGAGDEEEVSELGVLRRPEVDCELLWPVAFQIGCSKVYQWSFHTHTIISYTCHGFKT